MRKLDEGLKRARKQAEAIGATEVPGFPGYFVDVHGIVYSSRKQGGYMRDISPMQPCENVYGYLCLNFYKQGKRYPKSVHRIVAETFIENPNNKPQVNHIDGNKKNNNVSNLEWCTCSENILHNFRNLGVKSCGTPKPVLITDIVTGEKIVFESIKTCGRYMQTDKYYINDMLLGNLSKETWEKKHGCTLEYWDNRIKAEG